MVFFTTNPKIDGLVVDALARSGMNLACSVPCSLLAGVLKEISIRSDIIYVPVTREEEGVGVCAGAFLGGGKPVLLMQNSGLGNSLNALLSLTSFYKIGLLILIGFRGRSGEERINAQVPMGEATPRLLSLIHAEFSVIESVKETSRIRELASQAFEESKVTAALLPPPFWKSE